MRPGASCLLCLYRPVDCLLQLHLVMLLAAGGRVGLGSGDGGGCRFSSARSSLSRSSAQRRWQPERQQRRSSGPASGRATTTRRRRTKTAATTAPTASSSSRPRVTPRPPPEVSAKLRSSLTLRTEAKTGAAKTRRPCSRSTWPLHPLPLFRPTSRTPTSSKGGSSRAIFVCFQLGVRFAIAIATGDY